MSVETKALEIPEVRLISPELHADDRGYFLEYYRQSDFKSAGINDVFIQDCLSHSKKDILRGLHYQLEPKSQAKLVSCIRGTVFDVVVDIRKGSPTFGRWVGEELSEVNHRSLYIPKGFAHGFVVLSDEATMNYKLSEEYSKEHDRGILWCDPDVNIQWPVANPILSERDQNNLPLNKAENNLVYQS